jgi:hypothetical protein
VVEASRSSTHKVVPALLVKTVGAQVPIGFLSHQHMKDTGDLRTGHGDNGFLASTTRRHAVRQGRQVGPLGTSRGAGQLSQDGSQGLIPVAGAAVVLLACAGIVPRGTSAQAATWAEEPKRAISIPVSTTHCSAPRWPTPRIVFSRVIARIHVRGTSGCPGAISRSTVLDI